MRFRVNGWHTGIMAYLNREYRLFTAAILIVDSVALVVTYHASPQWRWSSTGRRYLTTCIVSLFNSIYYLLSLH